MSGAPSLAQRVEWTHGFRCATDKAVLKAMARWFAWRADGSHVRFTVDQLVAKSGGIPKRSVERALERLEADWWIEVTERQRGSRRPTTYQIVVKRLASADPDALRPVEATTATVADEQRDQPPEWRMKQPDNRHSGGRADEWRMKNAPDFEQVADQVQVEEVRTDRSSGTPPSSEEVRHSGGRPEHPDVAAFLAWARVTYPQHANGAHLELEGDRRRYVVHRLLEQYGCERLEQMAVVCWTIEADGDPESHATWIAAGDRSLYVLKHKAAFLERVVVGAQQLSLGPMVKLTAREIEEAKDIRSRVYNGCPHEPRCEGYAECVREIALARHVS